MENRWELDNELLEKIFEEKTKESNENDDLSKDDEK